MTAAEPGRRVAGRYHLIEPIGRGGMGIVWRAHDELLDRPVAVKEVRYNGAIGDELLDLNRRTMREARAAGRLTHPNVVVVHDVIEEDERPWIVMQLVPSRSLGQVIREDGPLPPERVAEIGLEVLKALRSAHAMGVLHRDVKPENVLLADDGRVVLTDFGIARVETDSTMTRTGLVGTPAFMPPERLRGGPAQRESDLWSLGATLYAAVEGKPPHDKGAPLPTMHAVLMDEPEPAVHAGRMAPVIEGLLRKDPAERPTYEQAERMMRQALLPEPVSPPEPPPSASRRTSAPYPQTGDVPGDLPGAAPSRRPPAAGPASGGPSASPSRPAATPGVGEGDAGPPGRAVPQTGLSLAAEAPAPARPGTKKPATKAAGPARGGDTRPETLPPGAPASGDPKARGRASGADGDRDGSPEAAQQPDAPGDAGARKSSGTRKPAAGGGQTGGKAGTAGSRAAGAATAAEAAGARSEAAQSRADDSEDPDQTRVARTGATRPETAGSGERGSSAAKSGTAASAARKPGSGAGRAGDGPKAGSATGSGKSSGSAAEAPDQASEADGPADGAAKAASSRSGASKTGAKKTTGQSSGARGSKAAKAATPAEESIGPEDPTLPKARVAKPAAGRSAAKPAGKPAAATGSGGTAGKGGKSSAATSQGSTEATGTSSGAKAADPDKSADTTRTQKISSWALDMLGTGRSSSSKAGAEGSERSDDASGEPSAARKAGKPGASVRGVDEPASAEGAGSPRTGEAEPREDDGSGTGKAAGSKSKATSASAKDTKNDKPGGSAAKPPSGTSKSTGASGAKGMGAFGSSRPVVAASGTRALGAFASSASEDSGRSGDEDGGSGARAEDAKGAAKAGSGPSSAEPGGTRRLEGLLSTGTDDTGSGKAAAQRTGDEADADARKADAERARASSGSGTAQEGKGTARGSDAKRSQEQGGQRPKRVGRISPFPPPYSKPSPQSQLRFASETDTGRSAGPESGVTAGSDFWQHQTTRSVSLGGGLSGLIANPITKIILVAVPTIVVVAVVAALLGMRDAQNSVSRRDGTQTGAPATSAPSESKPGASQSGGSSGGGKEQSVNVDPTASAPPSSANPSPEASSPEPKPSASKSSASGSGEIPAGWRRYKDPTGFSLALPKGWRVSERRGTQVFFRGDERSTFLLIDQTTSPKSNAKKDWEQQERFSRYRFSGYKRVRIESVDYFKTAADWEWTYNSGGARLHVINRGFVTDKKHGYAIYWSTLDKRWKKNLRYFKTFTETFRPAK
ncbi:protein kinase [Thermopolyspora sp. NPDC052614]|uniref:protein kinase domain-containing protein n=1 Tax=Thermopolyspora sp. NPDC052614 TaxID=3155682 RepID=UPI003426261D